MDLEAAKTYNGKWKYYKKKEAVISIPPQDTQLLVHYPSASHQMDLSQRIQQERRHQYQWPRKTLQPAARGEGTLVD